MKYSVSMTSRAEQDRQRAFEWYAANYSVEFATRWFSGSTRAMRSLSNRPERCHKAPESASYTFDLYELPYGRRRTKHRVYFGSTGTWCLSFGFVTQHRVTWRKAKSDSARFERDTDIETLNSGLPP